VRIVNLTEFRLLPSGVVFMKYRPCIFDEISVKGETWEVDFLYTGLTNDIDCSGSVEEFDILSKAEGDSKFSISLDFDCESRDGMFDDDQLFAVYEQKDIDGLIEKLKTCKGA